MLNRKYKIAIDGRNEKQLKTFIDMFNLYGKVVKIYDSPIVDTKTGEEVYSVIVFEVKAAKKQFEKLVDYMEGIGHGLSLIKGYWFM